MTDAELLQKETGVELLFSDDELEARRDHIVEFIADIVDDAGAEGAVIGLSGGIDSTTTAYLAVEALGADAVHGLLMPSSVNPDADETDAERVAEALDIEYDTVDINPIVDAFVDAAPDHAAEDRMALGNVRVRTRAVLNYFVANAENRVVLGTGNRSEAATGYYTKYGDQAVDCNPVGNLYKCQVRQLARELGVPEDLVTRTPTAAMWEGQTDEEEMGLDYDDLDAILALHVHGPLSKHATVETLDVPEEAVDRVVELHETSAHKRSMPPAPESL
ncbi:NAD synthase, ammonia-dependent [Natronomonas moolapensis 8.8.11]|uniref:NH(3)-dependent NAD(+) synthetase n=2 Tax=Halobacteriales TaxID=2235 RepID=M1XQK5_NATM8|nr:NAD+ synthase [Natronomonas moolapensis]CCQ36382.1 NAD synthase, ammonia-dependent [Natronomonas moolapensis 8.8.11]